MEVFYLRYHNAKPYIGDSIAPQMHNEEAETKTASGVSRWLWGIALSVLLVAHHRLPAGVNAKP